MAVFTIDAESSITAFADVAEAETAEKDTQTFTSEKELAKLSADWPVTRLVETWNGFAGVVPLDHLKPVKRFTDRNTAVHRIWQAIQKLATAPEAASIAPQGADGAPIAHASTHSATSQPRRPKAPKRAKRKPSNAPARERTKKAEVLALIQRPKGATLAEIQKATGWQAHSVRGFISGTLGKKMGLPTDSSRREDGERVYRLAGSGREA